jgi:ADP-ribose pyrophosphatase
MRRTLLTAGFFRVDELIRRDRGGVERTRRIVVHPGAAVILPLLDDGRVVLVRQFREAVGRELLELPAGKVDPQEDAATCARRELVEETGYVAGRVSGLCDFYTSPGILTEEIHAFVAEELTRTESQPEEDEDLTPVTMTLDETMQLIRERRIEDAKTLITLMMYDLVGRSC